MNEQNRLRLDRIATRHAKQTAPARSESETDAAFLAAFGRVRDEVLRPVMAEVGAELKAAGYDSRISPGGDEGSPAVDFHILIPERGESKDTIRFFALKDAERGWQVIAELSLKRSPVELTRFETTEEIAPDVAEQLIVDAVEQMFASTVGPPQSESPEPPPAPPREVVEGVLAIEPSAGLPAAPGQVVVSEPERVDGDAPRLFEMLPADDEALDPPLPPLPEAPEMRWARWAGVQGMGETEEVDVTVFRRRPLPFAKGAPTPAFFAVADAARAESRDSPGSTTGHETMMLPVVDLPGPSGEKPVTEAKPEAAGEEARAQLTVEQYAAFCAELAAFPDRAAEIHRRYGVPRADARLALDDAFAQRFRTDPSLKRRWQALVAHYGAWYRRHAIR